MTDRSFVGPLEFFPSKNILITGSTGFLGKVVVEKLLREIRNVGKLFLLIRPCPKKGTSPHIRLAEEMLASPLFDRLRMEKQSSFEEYVMSKIVLIEGDLDRDGFGLSENDVNELMSSVDVILHAAAASDWNESLELAFRRNVHATMQLLTLAKQMKRLKLFLHMSSAFVTCRKGGARKVEERIYPLGFDVDDAVHELSHMKASKMSKGTSKLLRGFANTHSFTKALAEIMVVSHKENVPVAVIRPSILGSTYRDPFPGWVDSLSVAGSLFLYSGLGMVNFVPGDPANLVDIVPVDYAANLVLITISQLGSNPSKLSEAEDVPIFHSSSSNHPLKWGYAAQTMTQYWNKHPPTQAVGPCNVYLINKYPIYKTQFLLKYKVPSKLYSGLARILQSDFHKQHATKLSSMVQKCQKLSNDLFHFVDNEWIFDTSNSDRLRAQAERSTSLVKIAPKITKAASPQPSSLFSSPSSISSSNIPFTFSSKDEEDKDHSGQPSELNSAEYSDSFNFDCTTIDWHAFIHYYCWGLRSFVLKDAKVPPPKTTELRYGRLLSRDLDGRLAKRPWLADLHFCYNASRNVAYPSVRQQRELNNQVLASPAVKAAIQQVSKSKSIPEDVLQVKAKEIMDRMATMQQKAYLTVLAWFFRKIWRNIYDRIEVNENVLMKLFEYSKRSSVVLVPSHRSYIDFLIVTYVLFAYDFPAPMIAAGEDFLNMSFISNLLRFGGAFFLRRTFRGDTLYNAIFTEYVQKLLLMGFPIEFFVEGTRSRSCKMLQPKFGLVNMLTDTYFNKQISDISFFPITLNYERIMEDAAYTREWMGEKKKAENLENLLKASSILTHSWGRISLKFCNPILLSTYTEQYTQYKIDMGAKKFDAYTKESDRKDLNIALSHQIVYDMNEKHIWSPLGIVGSVLLCSRNQGLKMNLLIQKVDWIVKDILRRKVGGEEWITEYPSDELVTKSLTFFREHVVTKKNLVTLVEPQSCLCLAFYRNRILHAFVRNAYVMSAFLSLIPSNYAVHLVGKFRGDAKSSSSLNKPCIPIQQLVEESEFLASVINKEFVYKIHPDESERIMETVQEMIALRWLAIHPTDPNCITIGDEDIAEDVIIYMSGIISSFVDSYWIALLSIAAIKPTSIRRAAFGQRIHETADHLWQEGTITTRESCSRETLNSGLSTWLRLGVLKGENFGEVIHVGPNFFGEQSKALTDIFARLTRLRTSTLFAAAPAGSGKGSSNPTGETQEPFDESYAARILASFPLTSKL